MKRIGVLTSGGDAPGMNAAIRAVARTAFYRNIQVMGIKMGYHGLIAGELAPMTSSSVDHILNRGGTILGTARAEEFKTEQGQRKAVKILDKFGVDAVVVIGGEGSFRGAQDLANYGIKVVGIPATIDNDIGCTDSSVGFDTAVSTVTDAISKIRDTATSHERLFVIEVMGRDSGFIAVASGLAGGAEYILIPEIEFDINEICEKIKDGYIRGKTHSIIVVAEGVQVNAGHGQGSENGAIVIGKIIKEKTKFDTRISILGHIQRGGNPTITDRILATRMGVEAVELLLSGQTNKMVGFVNGEYVVSDLKEAIDKRNEIDREAYEIATMLAIS